MSTRDRKRKDETAICKLRTGDKTEKKTHPVELVFRTKRV